MDHWITLVDFCANQATFSNDPLLYKSITSDSKWITINCYDDSKLQAS